VGVAVDTRAAFSLLNIGSNPPHPATVATTTSKHSFIAKFKIASSQIHAANGILTAILYSRAI
jgi:flagellum-specific peptidoglycan hydrolase FlgJ